MRLIVDLLIALVPRHLRLSLLTSKYLPSNFSLPGRRQDVLATRLCARSLGLALIPALSAPGIIYFTLKLAERSEHVHHEPACWLLTKSPGRSRAMSLLLLINLLI